MNVQCYARRRLRPFHGTLQTIAITHPDGAGHGEAESSNGRDWNLYVGHPDLVAHTGLSEVRFGTWRAGESARRAAVRGTARASMIEELGELLLDALERHATDIPFALVDCHECWLLDSDGVPLALIDSVIAPDERTPWDKPRWHPGTTAEEEFHSPDGGVAELVAQVAARAGVPARAVWIERTADGSGADGEGARYAADDFPIGLLRADWHHGAETRRARAFLAWQAPWLLQLSGLDDDVRAALESAAWLRPSEVARVWPLYPTVLDPEALKVARVQASLIGDDTQRGLYREPFLPVDVEV